MSCLGLRPPFQEQRDFRFTPDQRREASWLRHLQATGSPALTEHVIEAPGLGDPPQGVYSQVPALKIPLHQAVRRITNDNGIGRSQPLDSGGNIRGLTQ